MLKSGEEWVCEGNKLFVRSSKTAPMGTDAPRNINNRVPTEEEMTSVLTSLNEHSSFAITIYCRNEHCKAKNSWIQRSKQDIAKNVYVCESCGKPMSR